jgi:hypothetical protein
MTHPMVDEAEAELEEAQSTLDGALSLALYAACKMDGTRLPNDLRFAGRTLF